MLNLKNLNVMLNVTPQEIAYVKFVQYWLALEAKLNVITLS